MRIDGIIRHEQQTITCLPPAAASLAPRQCNSITISRSRLFTVMDNGSHDPLAAALQ